MSHWDVVVVGAGPAGAMAAHALARRGARVLLTDRAAFPRWKVCGACVSAGARGLLEADGIAETVSRLGGHELRALRLHARGRSASVPLQGTLALSRAALDASLVAAAERAGATFWTEARATDTWMEGEGRRLRLSRGSREVVVRARVIVDATGLGRGVRDERARFDEVAEGSRLGMGAVLRAARYPVEPGDLHMAVAPWGYVGLVRVEDGALNVAAALDPEALQTSVPAEAVSGVLTHVGLPPLREQPVAGWRGTPLLTRGSPDAGAERLFRVGDVTGYVEPFTGEGICWALGGGRAVAGLAGAAVDGWSDDLLERWRAYRTGALGRAQRLCRLVAGGLRKPWLVDAGVAALEVAPGLAAPFVARAGRAPAELRA